MLPKHGDGECFLFRLKPNPECFRYKTGSTHVASFDEAEESASFLEDAGQLMISSREFISMGVGEDGARFVSYVVCFT